MNFPETLIPLIARDVVKPNDQVLKFWHDTVLYVFPPGANVTIQYTPRIGYKYLVFGMTLGPVRDFTTGDQLTTDDYGFFHEHSQMRWHWDPGVESIYEFDYPHWLEVTDIDPVTLRFYNNTARTIIQDFSIWLFECPEGSWIKYVVPYLKGIYRKEFEKGLVEPYPPKVVPQ